MQASPDTLRRRTECRGEDFSPAIRSSPTGGVASNSMRSRNAHHLPYEKNGPAQPLANDEEEGMIDAHHAIRRD